MNAISKATAITALILSTSAATHAQGWIAEHVIGPIAGDHAAREADKIHEHLGKPLDHVVPAVAGAAADAVVPGSGPVVTGGLEAKAAGK